MKLFFFNQNFSFIFVNSNNLTLMDVAKYKFFHNGIVALKLSYSNVKFLNFYNVGINI